MTPKNPDTNGYFEYTGLDLPSLEKEVLQFWEENQIFEKSISTRPEENPFVFYEGPPSANGMPGIHHVMGRTIKDLFCRFKTLQGYRVERKAGWDTHGLPVELNVEKTIGITKKDIGTKISVAEYNKLCREDVFRFTDVWNDLTKKMGYWVDMKHPYITYETEYIESLWALLKILYDKKLLYKGFTIQPYSPAAGTGLSSHELNQPGCYRDVKDITAVAMFKVLKNEKSAFLFDDETEDVRILAWTTTPWTLPSNVALAVGADIEYVKIKTTNFYSKQEVSVILAANLLEKTFAWNNLEVKQAHDLGTGKLLEGITYELLLPYAKGAACRVITGDFVTTSDGTGVVHISPSHGADDKRVADSNGIEGILLVDRQGKFTEEVFDFAGEYIKEAYLTEEEKKEEAVKQGRDTYLSVDIRIVDKLKKENKLFKSEKYEHTYPHCWRTDKPVIYYPLDSWFIKTTAVKDRLIALNKTINWKPATTGENRFGQWLENLVDWNLSRSRYWGTPLPIWRTEDGTEEKCIGSTIELQQEIDKAKSAGFLDSNFSNDAAHFDLHKPFVDEIILVSESGKPMKREADLIDVWFDSGAMPYAQWHYPLENEAKFKANFPADFIAEGVDQTRGWFFTLHVLGVMLFDSVAYKNVMSNGLLLDAKGQKMSKRLGNIVDPFETIAKYGADGTRWYMMRNSDPWDNLKFDVNTLADVSRAHFGTLYNTYSFFALYANIDNWKPSPQTPEGGLNTEMQAQKVLHWKTANHMLYGQLKEFSKRHKNFPTPAEEILWTQLSGKKLEGFKFRRQHIIDDVIVDFICLKEKLIIEVDGGYHSDPVQIKLDEIRTTFLNEFDYKVIRFTNEEVIGSIDTVLNQILKELKNTKSNIETDAAVEAPFGGLGAEIDAWIISKLNTLILEVTKYYEEYEPTKAARAIETFVDAHLSNWYVRLCRRRFWKGEMSTDKQSAYETLYECLNVVGQLMSPITPFFSDWLYRSLADKNAVESVHLSYLSKATASKIDKSLEERMEMAQQITSMVLSLRKKTLIKVRQPLSKILIPVFNAETQQQLEKVESYILSEVNIKAIEYVTDTAGMVTKKAKPNFKTLGKKAGSKMKQIQEAVNAFTQDDIIKLEQEKSFALILEGEKFDLLLEDVEIISEDIPGWLVVNEGNLTVALDVTLTDELRHEGNAREFVNKVQNIRKDKGFQVLDRIHVSIVKDSSFEAALALFENYIASEILATKIEVVESLATFEEVEINDVVLKVNVVLN